MEAHVHIFLSTWQANHVSPRLATVDAETSKIVEFGLSLEGQATNWYSQHDVGEFSSFEELRDRFICIFYRQIPKRELMSQFELVLCHLSGTPGDGFSIHDPIPGSLLVTR